MKALLLTSFLMTSLFSTIALAVEAPSIVAPTESIWFRELEKDVNEKQQKAMALVAMVGSKANASSGTRDEADYAYIGFVARLQGIREDREALVKRNQEADQASLDNYSKRLDRLISDLHTFLK